MKHSFDVFAKENNVTFAFIFIFIIAILIWFSILIGLPLLFLGIVLLLIILGAEYYVFPSLLRGQMEVKLSNDSFYFEWIRPIAFRDNSSRTIYFKDIKACQFMDGFRSYKISIALLNEEVFEIHHDKKLNQASFIEFYSNLSKFLKEKNNLNEPIEFINFYKSTKGVSFLIFVIILTFVMSILMISKIFIGRDYSVHDIYIKTQIFTSIAYIVHHVKQINQPD